MSGTKTANVFRPVDTVPHRGTVETYLGRGNSAMIRGHAKAITPFGVQSGLTPVGVEYGADNLAVITFNCHNTPIELAVSGKEMRALVDELIACMGHMNREHAERLLQEADKGASAS